LAGSASQARRIVERNDLVDRLRFVLQRRIKLLFVDEAQLMSKEQRSAAQRSWTLSRQASHGSKSPGQPTDAGAGITLIAAFGVNGLVAYDLVAGSFNTAKYLAFLQKLKCAVGHKHVGLFYDGSSVHKSAAAKEAIEQNSWIRLLNVAYSQQDNPAEYLLNDVKHAFRKELLRNASLGSESGADGAKSPEVIAAELLA